jgi:hypothetical protein
VDIDELLVARLRAARPSKVRAYDRDGDAKDIAVPAGNRKKWQAVQAVLHDLGWARIEMLDAKGNILGVVDRPDDAGDLEELPADREVAKTGGMLALMLRGQEVALTHQHRGLAKVLDVQTELLKLVAQRLEVMERHYTANLEYQQELARALTDQMLDAAVDQAEAEEGSSGKALLQLVPTIVRELRGRPGPAAPAGRAPRPPQRPQKGKRRPPAPAAPGAVP